MSIKWKPFEQTLNNVKMQNFAAAVVVVAVVVVVVVVLKAA